MIKDLVCATLLSCACLTQTRDPFETVVNGVNGLWNNVPHLYFKHPMDIKENDKAFIVTVETPGFGPDELNIHIDHGDLLVISGKQKTSIEEKNEENKMIYQGRGSKEFKYSQILPDVIDESNIKNATLKNGILTITLPKAEKPKRTTNIKITG